MPLSIGTIASQYYEYPPPSFTGQTVLRLQGEGTNGAQNNTFSDSSSTPKTITRTGSVTQGSFSPFPLNGATYNPSVHGGSGYFNGTTRNYLSIPSNSAFNFASKTFTVEAWVYFNSVPSQSLIATNYSSTTAGWYLQQIGGKFRAGFSGDGGDIVGTTTLLTRVWYHVAVSGSAGSYKMFVNGVQEGATYTGATSLAGSTLGIGAFGAVVAGQYVLNGYISDLRIVDGAALYTSNFTRPTAPLTTTSNGGGGGTAPTSNQVSLLLNFTNGGVIDSVTKNNLVTSGNAQISTAVKKNGNSSIYFDGNGDVLKIPHSNDFVFGSKDFMISTWVYNLNTSGTRRTIFSKRANTTTSHAGIVISVVSGAYSTVVAFNGSSWTFLNGPIAKLNTWEHIALIRQGSNLAFYVDGRVRATATDSRAIFDSTTASVTIGADSDATAFYSNCYLDDFVVMTNP